MNDVRIGITVSSRADELHKHNFILPAYIEAVEMTGCRVLPVDITDSPDTVGEIDGLLLTGGVDVHPALYHQDIHPADGSFWPERDAAEIKWLQYAVNHDLPVFGICRGCQLINVALGGTLIQDIPDILGEKHAQSRSDVYFHNIRILPDTPVHALAEAKFLPVNSFHHQAVDRLAEGLRINAVNDSGRVIEAFDRPESTFLLATQWHPERTVRYDNLSKRLFTAFASACFERKKRSVRK